MTAILYCFKCRGLICGCGRLALLKGIAPVLMSAKPTTWAKLFDGKLKPLTVKPTANV